MTAHPVRRTLDTLYRAGGIVAAFCLIAILCIILTQMVSRWINISIPGLSEFAGYFMASASFLAFAYALNNGSHIRVSILLDAVGERQRYWLELWAMVIGTAATCYLTFYAFKLVYWSHKLNDLSQGQDATPMWIVQLPVAFGAAVLAICFIDNLVTLLLTGRDNIEDDVVSQSHGE